MVCQMILLCKVLQLGVPTAQDSTNSAAVRELSYGEVKGRRVFSVVDLSVDGLTSETCPHVI